MMEGAFDAIAGSARRSGGANSCTVVPGTHQDQEQNGRAPKGPPVITS